MNAAEPRTLLWQTECGRQIQPPGTRNISLDLSAMLGVVRKKRSVATHLHQPLFMMQAAECQGRVETEPFSAR